MSSLNGREDDTRLNKKRVKNFFAILYSTKLRTSSLLNFYNDVKNTMQSMTIVFIKQY